MFIKREIRDYLEDILQSVQDIREFVGGMDFPQFHSDRKTFHAVVRSLEIIGEAAKKSRMNCATGIPGSPGGRWEPGGTS